MAVISGTSFALHLPGRVRHEHGRPLFNCDPEEIFSSSHMDKVIFLSGTTRGGALEGLGRSFAHGFRELGLEWVELSLLLPQQELFEALRRIDPVHTRFVYSFVSMGMSFQVSDGNQQSHNLWQNMRVPYVTIHGDSPAYFFDRHVMPSPNFVSLYGFDEHRQLRLRLPKLNGPVGTVDPPVIDEVGLGAIDWKARKNGPLLFLKNGKDPAALRRMWTNNLDAFQLHSMLEMAAELEQHMDDGACEQIDDLVVRYFADRGFDIEPMLKLRFFFISQLDDYIRAYKCSFLAEALKDLPVEIRGNNWSHIDFSGSKVNYIDECDFEKSKGLLRGAVATMDMSPNTSSRAHDRVLRSYGAHGLCITNRQQYLDTLPHVERFTYCYQKESIQETVAWVLAHRDEVVEMGKEVSAAYRTQHTMRNYLQRMIDWASLAKLDQMRQRPADAQDFFCWPPQSLECN
jgi:hypothetical protein